MSEISRFTNSGKTFFFNKKESRAGGDYLSVNAMFGKGRYEKLTLLPSQLLEFAKHLEGAVEDITGFKRSGGGSSVERCHQCDSGPARHRVASSESGDQWIRYCFDCKEVLYENVAGAVDTIAEENEDG